MTPRVVRRVRWPLRDHFLDSEPLRQRFALLVSSASAATWLVVSAEQPNTP